MSFLDKAKAKLGKAVDDHGDKISDGIDRAARLADEKTGGKHTDKITRATGKAREALDSLDSKDDGDLGPGGAAGGPTPGGPTTPGTPDAPR